MTIRRIAKVFKSRPTVEGAGVHLKRAFGYSQVPQFDPFLMLDDFHTSNPDEYLAGFPWHPHRGIETITYVLEGLVEHGDSMGNAGVIGAGDVQWMTAGSGIIHQEMPKGDSQGRMYGLQLWANLPQSQKMMAPRYREVKNADIPHIVQPDGVVIRIISGRLNGISGPVRDVVIDPEYLDVEMPADTRLYHPTPPGHTAFIYLFKGRVRVDDLDLQPGSLALFEDGDQVHIQAQASSARFLFISGKPLQEPVAWRGPIVMNTQDELRIAFSEYQNGTFLKS